MDARLIDHNGAITISINGNLHPLTTFKLTETPDDKLFCATVRSTVAEVARRGVKVFFVCVYFKWPDHSVYDFSSMDRRVQWILEECPDAFIIIRIQAAALNPDWWRDANPDGVVKFGCGREPEGPKAQHQTGSFPSLGSDFWEKEGIPALEALAGHVKRQSYADRIAGYLPSAYNSNEWFLRSYHDQQVNDFCPAMQKAFGKWLKEKYGLGRDLLVPDLQARGTADCGYFHHPDPAIAAFPVVAYYRFLSFLCAEKIVKVTGAMRRMHVPDRIIIGMYYGYSLGLANFAWLADSAHLNLARLVEEDGPDFTCSPLDYFVKNSREMPSGGFCWAQSTAPDTNLIAGKGYFADDDSYMPGEQPDYSFGMDGPADMEEDDHALKRDLTFSLCKGQLQWWNDLHGHSYETAGRLNTIRDCAAAAAGALCRDRRQVSQIAVVMDEEASWYLTLDRSLQRPLFWENFFYSFGEIGAPVDLLLLSDLGRADASRYKAIFFPTSFAMKTRDREVVDSLKEEGRTLVFYMADGFIHPDGAKVFSGANMNALIGINMSVVKRPFQLRVTTRTNHPLLEGFEDVTFGVHMEKNLNFLVEDSDAEPMGHFCVRGPIALARKRHPRWTSIYCGVPVLPAGIVRNIIRDAGVHIFNEDDDILYANHSYVGVFTRSAGHKTVRLPEPRKALEVFSGKSMMEEASDSFSWDAERYHTYLFELT